MGTRLLHRIRADADVMVAVVSATEFARGLEFSETQSRAIGTVVSELATNIVKYADRGHVSLEEVSDKGLTGIQVTVADRGPGIPNVQQALQDHYSSSGTLGLGLPGVRRMVDDFDLQSEVGKGTTVVLRVWREKPVRTAPRTSMLAAAPGSMAFSERGTTRGSETFAASGGSGQALDVAFVNRPCRGELVSGDAVSITRVDGHVLLAVVDGLGHGRDANTAAKTVTRFLRKEGDADLAHVMGRLNERLRGTVGAAVSLCTIDLESAAVRYLAVGNTVLRIEGDRSHRIGAVAGTVGTQLVKTRVESAHLAPGEVLVIHTDGISDRAGLEEYPQMRYQPVSTVAETLVSRFGKRHDDATALVARFAR
jgi:anti-sigma regulatory factor (Ser/Thr protein kinase)/serine/threonine protein phosphatase PrpC